jgi:hypothetical protein
LRITVDSVQEKSDLKFEKSRAVSKMRTILASLLAAAAILQLSAGYSLKPWGASKAITTQQQLRRRRDPMVMQANKEFSLGNLFGGKAPSVRGRRAAASLEPHPSVRPHISPLNCLEEKAPEMKKFSVDFSELLPMHPDVRSGVLDNGLPYIILPNKSPPGRFEAHLQVFSGSGKCRLVKRVVLKVKGC